MTVLHQALANHQILGGLLILLTHINLTALHRNTVIAHGEMHTQNIHILTGLGITAVRVGRVGGILNK